MSEDGDSLSPSLHVYSVSFCDRPLEDYFVPDKESLISDPKSPEVVQVITDSELPAEISTSAR